MFRVAPNEFDVRDLCSMFDVRNRRSPFDVSQSTSVDDFRNFSVESFEVVVVCGRWDDPAPVIVFVARSRRMFVDLSVN